MTKRMLIDGTHAEETRVVVLDGNRLEDFDVETSTKQQLKGNIYLAKIVRVEPSLQAAFVEYGGARHGFLAFGEIHPDYYQIPVADRQRLIAQQEEEAREAEAAEDAAAQADEAVELAAGTSAEDAAPFDAGTELVPGDEAEPLTLAEPESAPADTVAPETAPDPEPVPDEAPVATDPPSIDPGSDDLSPAQPALISQDRITGPDMGADDTDNAQAADADPADTDPAEALAELGLAVGADGQITGDPDAMANLAEALSDIGSTDEGEADAEAPAAPPLETFGGETEHAEEREHRAPSRYLRNYKIQEVIRRRQIMLVQVVKEERGGKGAALTTYISLAGRFCVLMPNSPRGGGISRKITSAADRRRLKEITTELEIPSGMGLIVRTAGAARPKPEIRRDCEYLLQLWDDIRDTTMKSVAPALIYEEASLIKRVIRDVYSRDVDEVLVDGQAAWQAARDQMRLLMPSHANKVQLWQDTQPLFAAQAVDAQLDAMLSPTVQLRSGGYLVINQTEALVAIDVNSGRSTRERGIEETALRTNMEAAEEVARQLRLRDLAGLIVIDFIDMESRKHNGMVERKLKDSLKNDRARIQLGSISHFGLMEMSRQRLRPSLTETSFVQCPHCGGAGHVRSTEGAAIHVLRAIEEEGGKRKAAEIMVHVAGPIAMYILNHKRVRLSEIEGRYGMTVLFTPDPTLLPPAVKIDRTRTHAPGEVPALPPRPVPMPSVRIVETDDDVVGAEDEAEDDITAADAAPARQETPREGRRPEQAPPGETEAAGKRRRRRRRRGGRRDEGPREDISAVAEPGADQPDLPPFEAAATDSVDVPPEMLADETAPVALTASPEPVAETQVEAAPEPTTDDATTEETTGPRRRGRRGGRRRGKDAPVEGNETPPTPEIVAYTGPTPADPFGGGAFDIFDALEQAEQAIAQAPEPVKPPPVRRVRAKAAPAPVPPAPDIVPIQEAMPIAAAPEPTPPTPDALAEESPEPLVKPVLVDDAPAAPKRGWWRR